MILSFFLSLFGVFSLFGFCGGGSCGSFGCFFFSHFFLVGFLGSLDGGRVQSQSHVAFSTVVSVHVFGHENSFSAGRTLFSLSHYFSSPVNGVVLLNYNKSGSLL